VSPERVESEVEGRRLTLSNLSKVLYPANGFTKGAVLDYYARIAPVMLPHIEDRPMTLRRFPNGVDGQSFFEKHVPAHAPSWVRTVRVPTSGSASSSEAVDYAVVGTMATLMWAANLAALEFHVPLWHIGRRRSLPARPDHLVFDLDPGPGTSIVECCRIASWIFDRLAEDTRPPVAKTSGSKGLQVYIPLSSRTDWTTARGRALELARALENDHPDAVVTNMRKDLRRGRVLIDWSQNHPAKTTVAAYSLRARPEPTASTPVSWDEVRACERSEDPNQLRFTAGEVLDRVERRGDLFSSLVTSTSRR